MTCRDVIASELILNMPERIEWKRCIRSEEDERQITKDFRAKFQPYDPNE